jgi:hypothetical protein
MLSRVSCKNASLARLCERDQTRSVEKKQLDDGIDHTFVSAGGVRLSVRLCDLSFVLFDVYRVLVDPALENPIPKYNGHAPTGWLILPWELTRGATAETLGEELQ